MAAVVVTPPEPFLSLDEAKAHLRVDHDDDDVLIGALIAAACGALDGPQGWLGRAVGEQTISETADWFADCMRLSLPPVTAITSIEYVDGDGATQTLDGAVYVLGTDGRVRLAPDQSWPSVRAQREAVTITYTAGYATVPAPIKAAALLLLGDLYANRETGIAGDLKPSPTIEMLISPYRTWA
ncbi:head-tail connector protein [Brevundimonas sp. 2R-24]|uniref:Head-tail connector protein n=1 Tax=Peiella sedimenti TaxID=3061083 RepID=A0ABT8SPA7_9CAUL|nr:head-tail connector protein [Caulobacteraceae bacterium XZ-24]